MTLKKRGLGKGLDALLSHSNAASRKSDQAEEQQSTPLSDLLHLDLDLLQPGKYQPRKDMSPEALEELAESIRAQGVIQPIVIRKISETHYEIIAGERRWRAAQLAKLNKVPCIVKQVADDAAVAIALIENIQREDLMQWKKRLHYNDYLKNLN